MRYKLFIFDIAGTTVTDADHVAAAFQGAFRDFGIEVSIQEVGPLMGFRKTDAIAEILRARQLDPKEGLVEAIHKSFIGSMLRFYSESPEVAPMPGAEEIFDFLHSLGARVALNSGFPRVIVECIVHRFGWIGDGYVDDFIASDEVERGRPFPFMVQELMLRSGIEDPRAVVKVGDTAVDIQEGRMAGCGQVVAVTTGSFGRGALQSFSPDHVFDSLLELKALAG